MSQYTNSTQTTGIQVTEATPVEDRLHFSSLADLIAATTDPSEEFLSVIYDGMVVSIKEDRAKYIWVESAWGILTTGHTYPPYAVDVRGQNYANKTYNFVRYDSVAKYTVKFTNGTDEGLAISKNILPYHVLQDISSAIATMKSDATLYYDLEYPDRLVERADHLVLILDPKPIVNEVFKITLS